MLTSLLRSPAAAFGLKSLRLSCEDFSRGNQHAAFGFGEQPTKRVLVTWLRCGYGDGAVTVTVYSIHTSGYAAVTRLR